MTTAQPWSAPSLRALREVTDARFGNSGYADSAGYESSVRV